MLVVHRIVLLFDDQRGVLNEDIEFVVHTLQSPYVLSPITKCHFHHIAYHLLLEVFHIWTLFFFSWDLLLIELLVAEITNLFHFINRKAQKYT